MKLYIAGPMSGLPDFNYPAFEEAQKQLEVEGYEVDSPHQHEIRDDWEWIDYMVADMPILFGCEGIALLPGWKKSNGARLEVAIFKELGREVHPLNVWLETS